MPETVTSTKPTSKSTQQFVPVSEVRDGILILKDKSLRAILLASSINFALKSEDEQTAFIVQFQNFLNSLDFSCEIFVQSRMLDIRPYIASLEVAYKGQLDDLMRIQIREYIEFIKSFTEAANIMTKNFFVVVPYSSTAISLSGSGGIGGNYPLGAKKIRQKMRIAHLKNKSPSLSSVFRSCNKASCAAACAPCSWEPKRRSN